MQATDSGRLRSIDALRGIAAIAVVLFHFTWGSTTRVRRMPRRCASAPLSTGTLV